MFIDFSNVLVGLLIIVAGVVAVFSTTQLYRVVGTIATFMLLITTSSMPVLFIFIITGALGVHSFSDNFKNMGRYNYILLILVVTLMSPSLVMAEHTPEHNNDNNGLPSRVEIVEKVLEVEKITKQPKMGLTGTDYIIGDEGKLMAYILEGADPVLDASCFISVLYPDHTSFLDQVSMSPIGITPFGGMYYYDFTVPNMTGVYPVQAYCFFGSTVGEDNIDDYAITNILEVGGQSDIATLSPDVGGNYGLEADGTNCKNIFCTVDFNFTIPNGAIINNTFLSDIRVIFRTVTNVNRDFFFQVHNYNTGIWENMTVITNNNPTFSTEFQYVINESFLNPIDHIISTRIEVYDFDVGGSVDTEDFFIRRTYNATIVDDLRGNEELVVSKALSNVTATILDPEPIQAIGQDQVGEFLILLAMVGLFMAGQYFLVGIIGIFYGFNFYDGLATMIITAFSSMMIVISMFRKNNEQ